MESKKAMFNVQLQKNLGHAETVVITMACYEGESKEEMSERINFAFGLFDDRIVANNKMTLELEAKFQEEMKNVTPLKPRS